MRGEREKWTFVKQILMVHGDGPRRRRRVDIAEVHVWTLCKAPGVAHPKKEIILKKKSVALVGIEPQSVAWKSST
jgi:hypothetical protein